MIATLFKLVGGGLFKSVASTLTSYFRERTQRKATAQSAEARIRLAQVNKDARLELADHELQVLRTRAQTGSWKDEFVTILVSIPIIVAMVGALVAVAYPAAGYNLMIAAERITDIMTGKTIDFAELWLLVVAVALGTKPFRR